MATLQMVPAERRIAWRMHKVEAGETLAAIAKKYGATPGGIVAANNLKSGEAVEGDRLLIPGRRASGSAGAAQRTRVAAPATQHAPQHHSRHCEETRGSQSAGVSGSQQRQIGTRGRIFRVFPSFRYCLTVKKGYSMGDCALTTGGLLNVV